MVIIIEDPDDMRRQIREQKDIIARQMVRIAELEAIVEKLPKTADGQVVVPTVDTVYLFDDRGKVWEAQIRGDYDGNFYSTMGFLRKCEQCYSTREAAEAARKGGG